MAGSGKPWCRCLCVHVLQDPVPKVGKFGALYARPGQRVLLDLIGDMQVRPTPLEMRLPTLNPCEQHSCKPEPLVQCTLCIKLVQPVLKATLSIVYRPVSDSQ